MITIKEHIDNLVNSNAKHIIELTTDEEVKQWLNSLLWSVAGFKQNINEEELARQYVENSLFGDKTKKQVAYIAYLKGYRKSMEK